MSAPRASIAGTLYIVATPIGNRQDFTERGLATLELVNRIVVEDTRHSRPFLNSLGIHKPLISLHAHNEEQVSSTLVNYLNAGESLALISDAGTPLMSDPGYLLVKAARQQKIHVVPIPGPCALITALSAAGVPCDTFTFIGFLPAKKAARQEKLKSLIKMIPHTLIAYESPHRLVASLADIAFVLGENYVFVLAKELTKTYEHFISGTRATITHWLQQDLNHLKGEFVLILPPRPEPAGSSEVTLTQPHLLSVLLQSLPLTQAVKLACALSGESKNKLYPLALSLGQKI
jgi:16S rRNA (cytidine1402-2'-O)-methyltransferase